MSENKKCKDKTFQQVNETTPKEAGSENLFFTAADANTVLLVQGERLAWSLKSRRPLSGCKKRH